jgi:hypothetical protein
VQKGKPPGREGYRVVADLADSTGEMDARAAAAYDIAAVSSYMRSTKFARQAGGSNGLAKYSVSRDTLPSRNSPIPT